MGRRNKRGIKIDGWLNIDKEVGVGSTDIVSAVRRMLNAKKVGHAGTLDPMASGILPIALGEATKTIPYIQNARKSYKFIIKFGQATNTDDAEGEIIEKSDISISEVDIKNIIPSFIGNIEQIPPKFSAIHIDGKRAYDMARAGEEFTIKPRKIDVFSLTYEEGSFNGEEAKFSISCGKGTYIRAIARDMAKKLRTVGHLTYLRRCSVGCFNEKNAITLAKLEEMLHNSPLSELVLPVATALDDIPALPLAVEEAQKIRNGQSVKFFSKSDIDRLRQCGVTIGSSEDVTVKAMLEDKLLAMAELKKAELKPLRVFNL